MQQDTKKNKKMKECKKKKKKWFLNEIWCMTNYNPKWVWNRHSDHHQNPILHKPLPMKHYHWNNNNNNKIIIIIIIK